MRAVGGTPMAGKKKKGRKKGEKAFFFKGGDKNCVSVVLGWPLRRKEKKKKNHSLRFEKKKKRGRGSTMCGRHQNEVVDRGGGGKKKKKVLSQLLLGGGKKKRDVDLRPCRRKKKTGERRAPERGREGRKPVDAQSPGKKKVRPAGKGFDGAEWNEKRKNDYSEEGIAPSGQRGRSFSKKERGGGEKRGEREKKKRPIL